MILKYRIFLNSNQLVLDVTLNTEENQSIKLYSDYQFLVNMGLQIKLILMNKIYFFYFLLCSFYCYSQIETIDDIDKSRPSLTYIANDTVLALPFSSNNINILTNNPISSWYSFKSKKINLEFYYRK